MAMSMIRTGHDVSVWNRTADKTKPLEEMGAKVYDTKRQIVENCDIVFACVSDPKAARDVVFGTDGILKYINSEKSYVDMSTVDSETSIGSLIKIKLSQEFSKIKISQRSNLIFSHRKCNQRQGRPIFRGTSFWFEKASRSRRGKN